MRKIAFDAFAQAAALAIQYAGEPRERVISRAASALSARPSDIPGLWIVHGYPELTTGQLIDVAARIKGTHP